ncbi:MAG: cation:proton antiporter [Hydrogenophaga sp.]|jgi:NhaP-type Na+/H+ or K+/H+ antiporter|uniref:cation:proton antiporter n=1 Tax=Hydrogenophaga sp. TaxID=1904254 RepID=UPI0025B987A0|nr:cation:proton antiporter [Hydrogenophaga sp.]MDO9132324.1 cation:proton antiporter [Hydrogenophaga sp.]MDO9505189.1 cation:proton antiporter [Hydrogenophaga sp.]MDP3204845.1 cation:proton antiporter [Hydrogenophaga sp.]MDP3628427.1 cation:proton antiporter [Hydrogenophaga sp.]
MSTAQWFLFVGALLLIMGVAPTLLKRLPITPAMLYLAVGMLMGPTVLGLFSFNPLKQSALLELLTEIAVLISLFSAGVKMPVPFSLRQWRAPLLLASVSMAITVGLVAGFGVWALGLPLGAAVLLGAIVAPTDPVLATEVQSRHPGDRDQLRFTLTCEAGLNDGSAYPFAMLGLGLLGLHTLGANGMQWVLVDMVWSTLGGVAIGVACGALLARMSWWLRGEPQRHELLDDFLGLGLIGAVYGLSVWLSAGGFLAVFFAAVALRQTEVRLARHAHVAGVRRLVTKAPVACVGEHVSTVSEGSLVFKEHAERLSELVLVLLLGGSLYLNSWSWPAVGLALFVFFVARPVSVMLGLIGTRTLTPVRGMTGWFGVRGIGSLYYLMYAIQHGLPEDTAMQLIQLTLIVVTLSIVLHGISVKPLMSLVSDRRP